MDLFRVTIVGQDIFKIVEEILDLVGLNVVNNANYGMLGNLKTLTYTLAVDESEVIEKRKNLIRIIEKDDKRLMPLYSHGDWMRIYVFKPFKSDLQK